MDSRKGRQTPTTSFVLEYDRSLSNEAVELYEKSGNKAIPWQKNLLRDIMAIRSDKLWTHTKNGYSVSRRNGKTEVVYMRELWGLLHGEQIIHTAHRTATAHSSWEKLCRLLKKIGIEFNSIRAKGSECIEIPETEGKIQYRTRSGSGGLGEGFDLLIIDEAQEYTADQRSALTYTVSDSRNPQTIMCGTPPTNVSRGTVFPNFRKSCLQGNERNAFWAEWSVSCMSDMQDRELWYETNPSLGYHLTERKIEDEISPDDVDFNVQRLGLWLEYSQASAISKAAWDSCKTDILPDFKGKLYVGIKFSKMGNTVLSVAVKTKEDKVFIECLDCRESRKGNDWILAFLHSADIEKVAIDGASGQQMLAAEMKDARLKTPVLPTVKEIIDANAQFELGVFQHSLQHAGQISLSELVTNAEHRAIGSNGGYGYSSIRPEFDVALMESAAIAYWLARKAKPKKQRISY